MPYVCQDKELGACSGRAYKRNGLATALCRRHWYEFIMVLRWAQGEELPDYAPQEIVNLTNGIVQV